MTRVLCSKPKEVQFLQWSLWRKLVKLLSPPNEVEMIPASNLNLASKPNLGFNVNFDPNPYLTSTQIATQNQP